MSNKSVNLQEIKYVNLVYTIKGMESISPYVLICSNMQELHLDWLDYDLRPYFSFYKKVAYREEEDRTKKNDSFSRIPERNSKKKKKNPRTVRLEGQLIGENFRNRWGFGKP